MIKRTRRANYPTWKWNQYTCVVKGEHGRLKLIMFPLNFEIFLIGKGYYIKKKKKLDMYKIK